MSVVSEPPNPPRPTIRSNHNRFRTKSRGKQTRKLCSERRKRYAGKNPISRLEALSGLKKHVPPPQGGGTPLFPNQPNNHLTITTRLFAFQQYPCQFLKPLLPSPFSSLFQ